MHIFQFAHDWYFDHGVPGNLAASLITGAVGVLVGWRTVWLKHIKPHMQKTAELHRHMDPNDDWHIGDAP